MNAETFISTWETTRRPMIQYDKDVLINCNLSSEMTNELSQFGLPSSAPPTLSFELSKEMMLSKKFKLSRKYSLFYYFGFTGTGDFICFDTEKSIFVIVGHEGKMDITIMNSSLSSLYGCLQCYAHFIKEVQENGGPFAYIDGEISESQLVTLHKKLELIDRAATLPSSFWAQEIDLLRQRCKG